MTNTDEFTCICGNEGDHAAHWNTPDGTVLVVFSCYEACSDRIEEMRSPRTRRLSAVTIDRARRSGVNA